MLFSSEMVIKMPFSFKRLQALAKSANIRSFASMNSHMSLKVPRLTEAFLALVTGIRFLPSVGSHMYLQGAGPHECCSTLTRKWSEIGVPPTMIS